MKTWHVTLPFPQNYVSWKSTYPPSPFPASSCKQQTPSAALVFPINLKCSLNHTSPVTIQRILCGNMYFLHGVISCIKISVYCFQIVDRDHDPSLYGPEYKRCILVSSCKSSIWIASIWPMQINNHQALIFLVHIFLGSQIPGKAFGERNIWSLGSTLDHFGWIFRKLPNSLWPAPPPPSFRKTMLRFFREIRKSATKLCNTCTRWLSRCKAPL